MYKYLLPSLYLLLSLCSPLKAAELQADSLEQSRRAALSPQLWRASKLLLPTLGLTVAAKGMDKNAYELREHFLPSYRQHWDDVSTVLPLAASWGLYLSGREPAYSRSPKEMLLLQLGSVGLSTLITHAGKYSFRRLRPDASSRNSFPSGHSSLAFTSATLLAIEYGEQYPAIAALGYGLASATAVARIANKRHWLTDIITGSGVGIFSTRLVYTLASHWGNLPPRLERFDELSGFFISYKLGISSVYGWKASETAEGHLAAARIFGLRLRAPVYKQWGLCAEGNLLSRARPQGTYLQGFSITAALSYLYQLPVLESRCYLEGLLGLGYLSETRLTELQERAHSRANAWPITAPAICLKPEIAVLYRSSSHSLWRLYLSGLIAPTAQDYSRLNRKGELGAEIGIAVDWAW